MTHCHTGIRNYQGWARAKKIPLERFFELAWATPAASLLRRKSGRTCEIVADVVHGRVLCGEREGESELWVRGVRREGVAIDSGGRALRCGECCAGRGSVRVRLPHSHSPNRSPAPPAALGSAAAT